MFKAGDRVCGKYNTDEVGTVIQSSIKYPKMFEIKWDHYNTVSHMTADELQLDQEYANKQLIQELINE